MNQSCKLPLCLLLACCSFSFVTLECASGQEKDTAQKTAWAGTAIAPKAFRAAADKIAPSLVTIESFGGVSALQGRIGGIRKQGEGNTTGVIISEDGYVVTSTFNFIKKPPIITLITNDGKRYYAELMGKDETRKICILKIKDPGELVVPKIAPIDELRVGQWAISVGVGYGDANPAISAGIISAKNRIAGRAIQTDANISPANYGGPLIDLDGRLIGICSPLSPRSSGLAAGVEWYDSGIGFAISLDKQEKLLARLISGKDLKPAWLGIRAAKSAKGVPSLEIDSVVKGSPAEKGGIQKKDRIIRFNGEGVSDFGGLRRLLSRLAEDDTATITVKRGDKELDLEVTFTAAPANLAALEKAAAEEAKKRAEAEKKKKEAEKKKESEEEQEPDSDKPAEEKDPESKEAEKPEEEKEPVEK